MDETDDVVRRMMDYAVRYPRVNTVDREISDYQAQVEGLFLTYFHTATKTVLSIARAKVAPSRAQIERFKAFFDVPEWAMVERPAHPMYGVVRMRWNRVVQLGFDVAIRRGAVDHYSREG